MRLRAVRTQTPLSTPSEVPALLVHFRQHVQRVYDAIAWQWHGTRYKAWPRVVDFVSSLPGGSLVADLGCGNGKLAPAFREAGHAAIGCDFSVELVRIAAAQMQLEVRRPLAQSAAMLGWCSFADWAATAFVLTSPTLSVHAECGCGLPRTPIP